VKINNMLVVKVLPTTDPNSPNGRGYVGYAYTEGKKVDGTPVQHTTIPGCLSKLTAVIIEVLGDDAGKEVA